MSNMKRTATKRQREEENAKKTFRKLSIALVLLAIFMMIVFIVIGQ